MESLCDCKPTTVSLARVHNFLLLLLQVIFSVGQCVLILDPTNYEFPLTILIALATILALPVIYLLVRTIAWKCSQHSNSRLNKCDFLQYNHLNIAPLSVSFQTMFCVISQTCARLDKIAKCCFFNRAQMDPVN